MRGIDEETLLAVRASLAAEGLNTDVIDALISLKIRELNQWLPIDESTPMNRYLLCVNAVGRKDVLRLDWLGNTWRTQDGLAAPYIPTHYQELPDDPEPGDKNG